MYRKTKKLFAVSLVVTMLLTMTLFSGIASAAATSNRLEGGDRYATALNIVKAGWTSSEYAVLATGEGYADALAAAPLAKAYNAPILLVDPSSDNAALKAELTALGVTKVFIVGGEGVVSKAFADSLTGVTRLAGLNRVETSVKVAEQLVAKVGTISEIAVANEEAYADALSIAPIAANKNMPILLTYKDSLPTEVSAFLTGKTIAKSYVVGETGVVSDAVKSALSNAVRLGGANRYATNLAILSNFTLDYANVFVATGENYPDALAGSAYAAKLNAPVVLVDGVVDAATSAYVAGKATPATKVVALGGAAVVSADAVAGLLAAIDNYKFQVTEIKAVNARQLMVKFNKPVNEADAELTNKYHIGSTTPTTAVMQSDEMSVLLTMPGNLPTTANLYVVDPVMLKADTTVKTPIFTYVETYSDTVAPQVKSVEYPTYDKAKVTFTEPLSSLGTASYVQDGSAASVTNDFSAGNSAVTFDLTSVAVDKPVNVTIVGALDYANNLVSPNPLTLTFTKVKADTTSPTVVDVKALADNRVQVTFSEKLSTTPTVYVADNSVSFDTSADNVVFEGTFTPAVDGIAKVDVTSYTDMSRNNGLSYSRLVQFAADETKPAIASSEVKTFGSNQYLVVRYDEKVTVTTATTVTLSWTRVKDYITYTEGTTLTTTASVLAYTKANGADVDDTKAIMIKVTDFVNGSYTLTLPAGLVNDAASTPNASASASVSFAKGDLTVSDTSKPTVATTFTTTSTGSPFADDNTSMTVTFSEDMDPATALNVANYRIGGAAIFTKAEFWGNQKTVKLTTNMGSITLSGLYSVSISNVADKAGNVMAALNTVQYVEENVKPYVASSKLITATTVTVTFSENVSNVDANTDIEVYVNGTKVTSTFVSYNNKVATLNLTTPIDDLSKTIQVKLVDSSVVDDNGNKAVTGTLVGVTQ